MAEQGLDALLVSGEENFQYFTGSTGTLAYHYSCTRPAVLVFPREGEPAAVAGEMLTHSLAMTTGLRDLRSYVAIERFPYSIVVEALGDLAGAGARIGAELGHEQRMGMPVGDYLAIVQALPDATFEDAADLIVRLRMVKTPEEVAYMREAAAVTGRARQRLFPRDRPRHDGTRRGAPAAPAHPRGGRRIALPSCTSSQALPPVTASITSTDRWRRVTSSISMPAPTCAFIPSTTHGLRHWDRRATPPGAAHEVLLEANARMIEALRPGVRCSEVHRIGAEVITGAGYELVPTGRMGHGQGICLTEPPSISPDDHTVLEEGMVISTEPEVAMDMLWEDVHVITGDGSDQLTHESTVLCEIPFD